MRGHGHMPLGWAATVLIAVAYAHVLLELAAAVLAVAIAIRLLAVSPVRETLAGRLRRCRLLDRRGCRAAVIEHGGAVGVTRQRERQGS
jgi:hypothetical protein